MRGVTVGDTVTGAAGSFLFHVPTIGSYRVRAIRIGYAGRITEPIAVEPKVESSIRLGLRPAALPLDTLTVVAESVTTEQWVPWLADQGFYQRKREGLGSFLTREQIENKDPLTVADLLKGMPGELVRCGAPRSWGMSMRAATSMFLGRKCQPTVVLDGAVVSVGGSARTSSGNVDLIDPHNLEAIEVYPGPAGVPVQYSGYMSPCGAILLWSRR